MLSFGIGYDENTRAVVSSDCGNGNGAVLRPVFGEIPEAVQTDVITVVDCVGK